MSQQVGLGSRDGRLLLAARALRLLGIGIMVPVFPLYLAALRLSPFAVGAILTVGMLGGAVATAGFGMVAHRLGRRHSLQLAGCMPVVGALLLLTHPQVPLLLLAAFVGGISASGQDVGAPQALEQAAIADLLGHGARPFAWYGLTGSLSLAFGSLAAGLVAGAGVAGTAPSRIGSAAPQGDFAVLILSFGLTALGATLAYSLLSELAEGSTSSGGHLRGWTRLHRSRHQVATLAGLFSIDALAGGVAAQSLVAYYFHLRFGIGLEVIGPVLFLANLAAAASQLVAAALANRFGLLRTMVFTHLPSNVLLALVPLMPIWPLAGAALICRQSISQMDVPTRQAYTMAMVAPDERTAAASATGSARTLGAAAGPLVGGLLVTPVLLGFNLVAAGALKVGYDLLLYRRFRAVPLAPPASPGGRREEPTSGPESGP